MIIDTCRLSPAIRALIEAVYHDADRLDALIVAGEDQRVDITLFTQHRRVTRKARVLVG